ncbi:MAG: glycosyltransferase family 4 protein [Candidatus Omnitrophica bacterium]|nr:glycosyltransferase family 4 protein [Candidatus Omnitrophota bacterium]
MDSIKNRICSKEINMIALTMGHEGMCGGTRIFIELGKRWLKSGCKLNIFVTDEGFSTCCKYGLGNANFFTFQGRKYKKLGLFLFYVILLLKGIFLVLKLKIRNKKIDIVYSTSDFWPDSITAFIMAKVLNNAKWVAGFYLFAPNPFKNDNPYRGKSLLRGLLYYFTQLPIYCIVKRFADFVCVTSIPDVGNFITPRRTEDKILVIMGGVDCSLHREIPEVKKEYDACFLGRFHPQKGVIELIDIWRMVVDKKPNASLLIIGYGELLEKLKEKINLNSLSENVIVKGFTDGEEKVRILNKCSIVVHPALYDSGGMAACEAMACGLPAVSFDLPALKTYYPKGMLKTKCFSLEEFSQNILRLLEDRQLYAKLKIDALNWAKEWDWDKKAEFILEKIINE